MQTLCIALVYMCQLVTQSVEQVRHVSCLSAVLTGPQTTNEKKSAWAVHMQPIRKISTHISGCGYGAGADLTWIPYMTDSVIPVFIHSMTIFTKPHTLVAVLI